MAFILYDGPSELDGATIVAIMTGQTENPKTGPMLQTWILRRNVHPLRAINTGSDASICGSCPMRGIIERKNGKSTNKERPCYVQVRNAPRAVWEAYDRGRYSRFEHGRHNSYIIGKKIRLGAYGDPCAVPLPVWIPYLELCDGWTGYTHQWTNPKFYLWAKYIMASTHSEEENSRARAMGWRTFRTIRSIQDTAWDEIVCPASPEGGKRKTCAECMACDGGSIGKRSVAIVGHGGPAVLHTLDKMLAD